MGSAGWPLANAPVAAVRRKLQQGIVLNFCYYNKKESAAEAVCTSERLIFVRRNIGDNILNVAVQDPAEIIQCARGYVFVVFETVERTV